MIGSAVAVERMFSDGLGSISLRRASLTQFLKPLVSRTSRHDRNSNRTEPQEVLRHGYAAYVRTYVRSRNGTGPALPSASRCLLRVGMQFWNHRRRSDSSGQELTTTRFTVVRKSKERATMDLLACQETRFLSGKLLPSHNMYRDHETTGPSPSKLTFRADIIAVNYYCKRRFATLFVKFIRRVWVQNPLQPKRK